MRDAIGGTTGTISSSIGDSRSRQAAISRASSGSRATRSAKASRAVASIVPSTYSAARTSSPSGAWPFESCM